MFFRMERDKKNSFLLSSFYGMTWQNFLEVNESHSDKFQLQNDSLSMIWRR